MPAVVTEPAAGALIVIDEKGEATLSDIARVTGKPVSTVQRAVDRLLEAKVLTRSMPRGPVRFAADAPRQALRDLAAWRLGPADAGAIADRAHGRSRSTFSPPSTVRNPAIRQAWSNVMESIVSTFNPLRVVVFGSQARGDGRPDSDLDLLVVFDDLDDRRERRVQLRRLMSHEPFAKDVLVATPADVERPPFGSALADAVREGVTVYER
jgi:predicted nucleotidyltransferase/DNA-binding transcriptional ArsR family regulator